MGLRGFSWLAALMLAPLAWGGDIISADAESRALGPPRQPAIESRPIAPRDASTAGAPGAWRTALSLGGVLTLIVAGAAVLRRWARSSGSLAASAGAGGRSPAGILEILGRYPLARGQTLLLLKIERRVLLVSQTLPARGSGGGLSVLAQIDDADEVASILLKARDRESETLARRFEATLRSFEHRADEALARVEPARVERPASASLRRRLEQLRAGVSA